MLRKYEQNMMKYVRFKKKFSFFFKDFIFYGMLTSVNKLSVLLTFPFLARYFSVEEYGKLDFLINLISLTIVIIVLVRTLLLEGIYRNKKN